MGNHSPLITSHRGSGWPTVLTLLCALGFLIAGVFLPFTSVTKLWIFENQASVFQGLISLWKESELFLFLILFVFTICFPIVKISALLALWLYPGLTAEQAKSFLKFVSHLGKWSMLDVFVVAILVSR